MAHYRSTAQFSEREIDAWRKARWRARTDLGYLCRDVLGYKHVSDDNYQPGDSVYQGPHLPIHQPLIDTVQHFLVPTAAQMVDHDLFTPAGWKYKPLCQLTQLPGRRRTLILDSRGFLKTTINTMAHTIQAIINYPDIAVMVVQSNGKKANLFLKEIKEHFTQNPAFRSLFPEHCPVGAKVNDFGTREDFTSCARNPAVLRREPTVMATSIDKGMSGIHVDWIKCSDIVDPQNIVGEGLEYIKTMFSYLPPLLVSPAHWIDVEGTRYHSYDCYGKIIEDEMNISDPAERTYNMYIRSCFQRIIPGGGKPKYTLEELKYPFKRDENGKRISWWPERFTVKDYEYMEMSNPDTFATQQLNDPSAASGTKYFPVSPGKYPTFIDRADFSAEIPIAYREIIIDTAETLTKRADYTVLTVASWDNSFGRLYIEEIHRGRWLQDHWINLLVKKDGLLKRYRPLRIKIEETGYVRGLFSSLQREMEKAKRLYGLPDFTIDLVKRENNQTKPERIANTLQVPYMNKDIRFLTDIDRSCELHNPLFLLKPQCTCISTALNQELENFPKGKHDDILDTLADAYQNKKYFGRMTERIAPDEWKHKIEQAQRRLILYGLLPGEEPEGLGSNEGYYF